ncbi:MAG: hypothetical protein QM763_00760 [Agriterribacter sp.]
MRRPFWMNNHGDDADVTIGGWKHFNQIPDSGGRKDHFLTNAFAVYILGWSPLYRIAANIYEGGIGIPFTDLNLITFDPDKIDEGYNEKGREFGQWLYYNFYNPYNIYSKVKELIVEGNGTL